MTHPSNKNVWLITGAGRGLGVDIAKAALAAGHAVVATGRDPAKVAAAIGPHDNLLTVTLDVTRPEDAEAAVAAAVDRFGRLDVLVNNAGNFYAGFFEELSPDQVRRQIETLLFGPMNVTRAALPVMRRQRAGLLLMISSTAGLAGGQFCSAYAAAKFGLEGWVESLTPEIAPFGLRTMLVEPGFFRTELLSADSTTYAAQPSTTMPNAPVPRCRRGAAWMVCKEVIRPSLPAPSCSWLRWRHHRPASPPEPMRCRPSRPRPACCWRRRRRTGRCPPRLAMTTSDWRGCTG